MSEPKKAARKKAPPRARKGPTVAEEPPNEPAPEAVAEEAPSVEEATTVAAPLLAMQQPATPPQVTTPCVNCGAESIVTTHFPWTPDKSFCRVCLPVQYRYLV